MHRQTQTVQVLHCRRKATGKGKAGRSGPSGTGNRRQGNPRPRARRQPADACVLRRIDAGSRGRALQQWIGGVHADVKGLCFFDRAACVCVPAFRPRRAYSVAALPDLFLVFILTRSIGRSTAAATCDPCVSSPVASDARQTAGKCCSGMNIFGPPGRGRFAEFRSSRHSSETLVAMRNRIVQGREEGFAHRHSGMAWHGMPCHHRPGQWPPPT